MSRLNSDDLHRIFERLDRDRDGRVSIDELNWLLERIGIRASHGELEWLAGKSSLDLIDFMFFYEFLVKGSGCGGEGGEIQEEDEAELAKAFGVFDLDGDGFITCEELQTALSRLGVWEGGDCRRIIKEYDKNSDGLLDFEEFKTMMLLTNS